MHRYYRTRTIYSDIRVNEANMVVWIYKSTPSVSLAALKSITYIFSSCGYERAGGRAGKGDQILGKDSFNRDIES